MLSELVVCSRAACSTTTTTTTTTLMLLAAAIIDTDLHYVFDFERAPEQGFAQLLDFEQAPEQGVASFLLILNGLPKVLHHFC
jgi:hypothetical protein